MILKHKKSPFNLNAVYLSHTHSKMMPLNYLTLITTTTTKIIIIIIRHLNNYFSFLLYVV